MADTKTKALISIGRFLIGVVVGALIYYLMDSTGAYEPIYSIGAGIIVLVMVLILLSKLKGGGD
ncbi:hypothetical protein FJZ26_05060 [Candidatus Parvarchaeota archaeon]|nr:hypothetical protein [Candidatus Parvarchaeota archaeon]